MRATRFEVEAQRLRQFKRHAELEFCSGEVSDELHPPYSTARLVGMFASDCQQAFPFGTSRMEFSLELWKTHVLAEGKACGDVSRNRRDGYKLHVRYEPPRLSAWFTYQNKKPHNTRVGLPCTMLVCYLGDFIRARPDPVASVRLTSLKPLSYSQAMCGRDQR